MNPITTASKLKSLRYLKGLSLEEVAKEAQLNLDDYKALETGKTKVSKDKLKKACNALGIDYKEWFEKDNSHFIVNHGEINNGSVYCETCYYNSRSEENDEMLETLKSFISVMHKMLDEELFVRKIDKILSEREKNPDDEE